MKLNENTWAGILFGVLVIFTQTDKYRSQYLLTKINARLFFLQTNKLQIGFLEHKILKVSIKMGGL